MSDDLNLKIEIDATGAARAAGEIDKVTRAVGQNSEKVKIGSVEIDKLGSSFGLAGQAIGKINPQVGQLTTMMGAATGVIQTLTTAGIGPLGMAISAVSIAVTAGVQLWDEHNKKVAEATKAINENGLIKAIQDLAKEYDDAAAAAANFARISSGQGTASETLAMRDVMGRNLSATDQLLAQKEAQLGRMRASMEQQELGGRARTTGFTPERAAQLEREVDQLRRLSAQQARQIAEFDIRQDEIAATAEGPAAQGGAEGALQAANRSRFRTGGGRARGGGGGGGGRTAPSGPSIESLMAGAFRENPLAGLGGPAPIEDLTDYDQQKADRLLAYMKERERAEEELTDKIKEQADQRAQIAEEEANARIKSLQDVASITQTIGGATMQIYDLLDNGSKKSNQSQEQLEKARLRRIGIDQGIQAGVNTAMGFARVAVGDVPGSVAAFTAAAINVATAAKAGVDAGNVPSSGARGGGRAGDAMRRDSQGRGGSGEPTTVVVNMNGPVVAATDRAELGRQLGRIVDEGRQRYGT